MSQKFYCHGNVMSHFSSLLCLLTGSQDGRVHVWGSDSGQKLTVLEGNHPGPIQCVGFNPKLMMLASACTNMVSPPWRNVGEYHSFSVVFEAFLHVQILQLQVVFQGEININVSFTVNLSYILVIQQTYHF